MPMPEPAAPPAPLDAPSATPFSFIGTLKHAIRLWRRQWWKLVLLSLAPAAVVAVVAMLIALGLPAFKLLGRNLPALLGTLVVSLALIVAGVLVAVRAGLAYLHLIVGADAGIGLMEAWAKSKGRVLGFIWISLLSGLVIAGGNLAFLVPGIIWSVSFAVLPWVYVAEDVRGLAALIRARQWVIGDGWRVFLMHAILFLLLVLVSAPFGLADARLEQGSLAKAALGFVSWALQFFIVSHVTTAFTFAVFDNLRALKPRPLRELPKQAATFKIASFAGIFVLFALIALSGYMLARFAGPALRLGASPITPSAPPVIGPSVLPAGTIDVTAEEEAPTGPEDNDIDGLTDDEEVALGTDPADPDTDGDGLADGDEIRVFRTSPTFASSNRSPYDDGVNLRNGYNPLAPGNRLTEGEIEAIESRVREFGLHDPTPETLGRLYQ
jgi:hypothetical protein